MRGSRSHIILYQIVQIVLVDINLTSFFKLSYTPEDTNYKYCIRSCLWVCVWVCGCVFVCLWVCCHGGSRLRALHRSSPDCVWGWRWWPSPIGWILAILCPREGVCGGAVFVGFALLQPACSVCVSLGAVFFHLKTQYWHTCKLFFSKSVEWQRKFLLSKWF